MNLSTKIIFYFVVGLLTITGLYSSTKNQNPQKTTISQQETLANQAPQQVVASTSATEQLEQNIEATARVPGQELATTSAKKVLPKTDPQKNLSKEETVVIKVDVPTITIVNNTIPATELDKKIRDSLINILCIAESEGYLKPISGTGVTIDPKGIIITNAHIGQYFLVKDYPKKDFIKCFARNGSPAREAYSLELVYLPSAWIEKNLTNIVSDEPLGTGENDFAILKITGPYHTNVPLPASFPFLNPEPNPIFIYQNEEVELAGYPAGFLGALSVSQNLYINSTISKIYDFYTFHENTIDLLSLGGSIVAQKGSSGGAVSSLSGNLLGIIVTTTSGKTTGERDLRAVTLNHINNKLLEAEKVGLKEILSGDISAFSRNYNENTAPGLSKLLIDQIKKRTGAN